MTKYVNPYYGMEPVTCYGATLELYSYIIIPVFQKSSLLDLLMRAQSNLPLDLQGFLARGIVDALEFFHNTNGLGHLDIKPDNIVLNDDFLPVLIDFAHANYANQPTLACTGTNQYLAPEVRQVYHGSNRGYIPHLVDSFDFGIVLFTIAFRRMPFAEATHSDEYYRYVIRRDFNGFFGMHEINTYVN